MPPLSPRPARVHLTPLCPVRLAENLYAPVAVVRTVEGMLIVRTLQGEGDEKEEIFLRMKEGGDIVNVKAEHKQGVQDIMNLSDFSSKSLLNTYESDVSEFLLTQPFVLLFCV